MSSKSERTVSAGFPAFSAKAGAAKSSHGFLKAARAVLIIIAAILAVLIFVSDTDSLITGRSCIIYPMGGSMVNYSAGFIRRGLFGEIMMLLNTAVQPIISIIILSAASLGFIFYILLGRMIRLKAGFPFILATLFAPSLIMMQRDTNFLRTDGMLIALNLAASCILLHLLFRKRYKEQSFSGMLCIDAVILTILLVSALIHELSASLLPPVMLLYFLYARKARRVMHFIFAAVILFIVYAVMMTRYKYSDPVIVAESWSGVYSDTASIRFNPGLVNVADRSYANQYLNMSVELIKKDGMTLLRNMLITVLWPFAVLMLSGISVFRSASVRAMMIRFLLIASCLCPIGLSLVGIDFGRWFALSATNLAAYTLLIAHPAFRRRRKRFPRGFRRATGIFVKGCVIVTAAVLFGYRLDTSGYFFGPYLNYREQARQIITNTSNLPRDMKPLLTREKVIQKSGC